MTDFAFIMHHRKQRRCGARTYPKELDMRKAILVLVILPLVPAFALAHSAKDSWDNLEQLATKQRQTATKRIVVGCACLALSLLAIVWFGLLQTIQASENIRPDRQVSATPTKIQPKLVVSYGKLPLSFEANQGQSEARVRFLTRGGGYTIFFTDDEAILALRKSQPGMSRFGRLGLPGRLDPFGSAHPRAGRWPSLADDLKSLWPSLIPDLGQLVPEPNAGKGGVAEGLGFQSPQVLRMRLVGCNAKGNVIGLDELPGRRNYFIGNDPKQWRTNVPTYAKVRYQDVYPGVDLVYYGNHRQLEYDFVVAPGADPNQIKLSFAGADGMRVDAASGDLVVAVGEKEVRLHKPAVYQAAVAVVSSSPSPSVAAVSDRQTRGPKVHALECGSSLPLCAPQLAAGFSGGRDVGPSDAAPEASFRRGKRQQAAALQSGLRPQMSGLDGSFVLASNNEVAFRVAGYDPKRALVIDPVLSYSTYLGGSGGDWGSSIALDAAGSAYVTGWTTSSDFPTANPLQANCVNCLSYQAADAFVAKLNPAGNALVYSTYLGGSNSDGGSGIAVDAEGNAYVTGFTTSDDFPTANPLQAVNKGTGYTGYHTGFVAKLNSTGSALVYSTYLGGSGGDEGSGIGVDSSGNAYVTGVTSSTDFPTANPLQTNCDNCGSSNGDAFVAKLNASGSALVYSNYLGGSNNDGGNGIAVDAAGNTYVTGSTFSTDFPTANPLQTNCDNCGSSNGDAFVAKLNASGSALVYSTYLGGSNNDGGNGIAVDAAGNTYVTGSTFSTDFPTANPLQANCDNCGSSNGDAFVAKLNASGSALVYSTYLGGSGGDWGISIALDAAGSAYVMGSTTSSDFPTANPLQATNKGTPNTGLTTAFVAKLNPAGSALVYSTYLGGSDYDYGYGIAADAAGSAYVTGYTSSTDFPTANPLQANCDNCPPPPYYLSGDAFVAKLSPAPAVSLSTNSLSFGTQNKSTASAEQSVTLTNTGDELLSITGITVSGDFALATAATSCPYSGGSVAAQANCSIDVTFTPSDSGARSGTLTITDNASGSPQSVALSGTGQDFTFAASSGSSTSATVAPGQSATYTLSVGGQGGMNQNVTFTCTGAPSEATCTVSPNPLTVGSSATNVTITVATTAASVSAPRSRPLPPVLPLSPVRGMLMLALALAAMAWAIGRRNQSGVSRWQSRMALLASGLLLTLALGGCGGTTHDPGTRAGTYTLTVTGTAGSGSSALSHSVTLTLNVN